MNPAPTTSPAGWAARVGALFGDLSHPEAPARAGVRLARAPDHRPPPMTAAARIPPVVRAVFFDAVGTLLHPEPPAGAVYAVLGRRFGSRLDPGAVAGRFRTAFRRQ